MAMAVNFRWNKPTIATPKTGAEKERIRENLGAVGDAIMGVKRSWAEKDEREYQRQRQAEIDRMNAEDRDRRNADEDRRKQGFQELAARMSGKKAERESLLAEKAKIESEIAALKAGLGG